MVTVAGTDPEYPLRFLGIIIEANPKAISKVDEIGEQVVLTPKRKRADFHTDPPVGKSGPKEIGELARMQP